MTPNLNTLNALGLLWVIRYRFGRDRLSANVRLHQYRP